MSARTTFLAVATAGLTVLSAFAIAQEPSEAPPADPPAEVPAPTTTDPGTDRPAAGSDVLSERDLRGQGDLWAAGQGEVHLEGRGWVAMHVHGDVTIIDHAGDATLRIGSGDRDGFAPEDDSSRLHLQNVDTSIRVRGSHVEIVAEGRAALHAAGRGQVTLQGRGRFHTGDGDSGTWNVRLTYSG